MDTITTKKDRHQREYLLGWPLDEMVAALADSPILLKEAENIRVPLVPVLPFPVSREQLDRIYND